MGMLRQQDGDLVLCGDLEYKRLSFMDDTTEAAVLSGAKTTKKVDAGWQALWFLLHLAAVYLTVHFWSAWLAGWTRDRVLPFLQMPTTSSSDFEFVFSHLFAFSFVPAFLVALGIARFRTKVAQFVWIVPTVILAYKLITFSSPPTSVLFQGQSSSAFHQYFGGDFLIPEYHDWHEFWEIVASNPDMTRGLAQHTFTAPFYAGLGYSLAAWICVRTQLHRKLNEAIRTWEDSRFAHRE